MKRTKLFSLLLVIVMLFSMIPASVFAATTGPAADTHTHNYHFYEPGRAATCTQPGYHYLVCDCGLSQQVNDPALGHAFGAWSGNQPTCTAGATQTHVCSRCGYTESRYLDALGHNWGPQTVKQEPTCTVGGHYDITCRRCGFTGTFKIDALGHEFGEWYVVEPATAEKEGLEKRDCVRSDISETRPIPKLPSDPVPQPPTDPDACTAAISVSASVLPLLTSYTPGQAFNYDVSVSNSGGEEITDVSFEYVSVNAYGGFGGGNNAFKPGKIYSDSGSSTVGDNDSLYVSANAICAKHGKRLADSVSIPLPTGEDGEDDCDASVSFTVSYDVKPSYIPGSVVPFTIYVTNPCNCPLEHVNVSENGIGTIVSSLAFAANNPGTVSGPYTFQYNVPETPGVYTLVFAVSGECGQHPDHPVGETISCTLIVSDDALTGDECCAAVYVTVYFSGLPSYAPGETVDFNVYVTNPTTEDLCDITVGELNSGSGLAGGLSFTGGPGEWQGPFTYSYTLPMAPGYYGLKFVVNGTCTRHHEPVSDEATITLQVSDNPWSDVFGIDPYIYVANNPIDPHGFQVNETIIFAVTVTNTTPLDFVNLYLGPDAYTGYQPSLEVGNTTTGYYYYTVTQNDIDTKSFITMNAYAVGDIEADPWSVMGYTNDAIAYLYKKPASEETVSLLKEVTSIPAKNGVYREGEVVHCLLTITNDSDEDITANLYDFAADSFIHPTVVFVPAHSSANIPALHTVVYPDCISGEYTNRALMDYVTASGEWHFETQSNPVTVPCTAGESGLKVSKVVASKPKNGLYFTEDEVITFNVCVQNTGETMLEIVNAFDCVDDLYLDGRWELYPNESFTTTFTHTVTKADVEKGYVINYAYARSALGVYAMSNPAIADTDGKPDEATTNGFDPLGDETHCEIRLTAHGAARSEYEMTTCGIHGATEAAAERLLSSSSSAETWREIAALWTEDINALYDKMEATAKDEGSRVILNGEKITYFAQLEALKSFLQMSQDEAAAEQTIALLLREKAISMCYEAHEAPAARTDSVARAAALNGSSAACGRISAAPLSLTYAIARCEEHAFTVPQKSENADELTIAWLQARRGGNTALNRVVSKHYAPADAAGRSTIALFRTSFQSWLEAREQLLTLLYPESPDTVSEVITMEIMNTATLLCSCK